MRDYPKYNPSVAIQVGSGQSPMAEADEDRANLYGQLAHKAFGIAQGQEDKRQSEEGILDAEKQGLNWNPKSSLTEAGRAYNQEAESVVRNTASSQILTSMNGIFNHAMNQPVSDHAKNGNLAQFTNTANKYYQKTIQNINPKMRPYIDQIYNSSLTSYGSRIANRVGSYMRAQTTANYQTTANQLSNSAGNQIAQSYATPNLKARAGIQQNSFNILQSAIESAKNMAVSSGDPKRSGAMIQEYKNKFLNASIVGRYKGMIQQYNNANDPDTKAQLAQQIQEFPQNFAEDKGMQKVYGQVSLDDNMSAINQENMTRTLNTMSSQFHKSLQANTNQMQLQMKNAVISVNNGSPIPTKFLSRMQSEFPKIFPGFNDKIQIGHLTYSMYQDYTTRGIGAVNGFINKYSDPHTDLTIPGMDANVGNQVKTQLIKQFNSYLKEAKNDPYSTVNNTAPAKQYISNELNSLHSTNPNVSNARLQTELSNSVNNPMLNFQSDRTPEVSEAMHNINSHMQQLQNAHGISNQTQTLLSKNQAIGIVNNLNNMDPISRIKAINTAQNNYGNHWGMVQRALLNNKLPYQDIISSQILRNTNNNQLISDIMSGSDTLKADGTKVFTDLGTTYKDARTSIMNALPSKFISDLNQNPGSNTSKMVSGLVDTIMNASITRLKKDGKSWSTPSTFSLFGTNDTRHSVDDVMDSLYQNGAKDGIRVPYKIISKDPNGGYSPTAINYNTVKTMMAYYKNKASDQAMVEDKNVDVRKALSNAKWINDPSGEGLTLVQSNGKPFFYKNKKPYSFTFETAAHPGSLPTDYNEYSERHKP